MTPRTNRLKEYPVDSAGHMLDYVKPWTGPAEWRPNEPFQALLVLDGYSRGRSSATFQWRDQDGHKWQMFMSDMEHVLNSAIINRGSVTGWWRVRKAGQNYGIEYLGE